MDYKSMKYQELQTEAKNRGLNTYQKKKNEIIEMLELYDEHHKDALVSATNDQLYNESEDITKVERFIAEQANFNKQVMDILSNLVGKSTHEEAPLANDVKINEEIVVEPEPEPFQDRKINEVDEQDVNFIETDEVDEIVPVEPRILRSVADKKVSEVKLVGGAPEGMLLETYLGEKGMSFNELENAVHSFSETRPQRVLTMDDIKDAVIVGNAEAKSINSSSRKSITITDPYVADALQNIHGWKSNKKGGTYSMER